MKLQQLGIDFNSLNQEEQRIFFLQYVERRIFDLSQPVTFRGKKSSSNKKKGKNVKITSEALEILKGLKLI